MIRIDGKLVASCATVALLAGCAAKAPPPPPPPPPPPAKVVVIPPRPTPPNGASPNLAVPQTDATGLRYSVNRNITPAQQVWNLRSAYNVAALNCADPEFVDILTNYKAYLKANDKTLAGYNRKVDAEFKAKYGKSFIPAREKYMTEVYNHYALPPTIKEFCRAVLAMSRDGLTIKPAELEAFSVRSLPNVEIVFDDFYRRYDAYVTDLADWTAKYMPAAPTPVAPVLSVPAAGAAIPVTSAAAPATVTAGPRR